MVDKVKLKKLLIVSFGFFYLLSFYLNFFVNFIILNLTSKSFAQEEQLQKVNLIAIFVDRDIYENQKYNITWYAKDYIQKKYKNTKTLIIPINTKNFKPADIKKIIENLYFDGQKDANSQLNGIILIGNIPLPIINQNGYIYPSVYPYVDLVSPKYILDKDDKYFVPSGFGDDKVEIWHSIIKFTNNEDYNNFFNKLKKYVSNPTGFVDKKFWFTDFIALKDYYNKDILPYYVNNFVFAKALVRNFYNSILLKLLNTDYLSDLKNSGKNIENNLNIYKNLADKQLQNSSSEFNEFKSISDQYFSKISNFVNKYVKPTEKLLNQQEFNIPTKLVYKSAQGFLKNIVDLFSPKYISKISDNLKSTGRWIYSEKYISSQGSGFFYDQVDNDLEKILYYDTTVKYKIAYFNKILEKALDDIIENNKYYMLYPLLLKEVKYSRKYSYNINCYESNCNPRYFEYQYENFYFGLPADKVNSTKDLYIYRGKYRNFTKIQQLSGKEIGDYKVDDVDLNSNYFSIGNSYGFFDMQVEANRGYNFEFAKTDGDLYKNNRCSNSETLSQWALRWWGGASPLNLNTDKLQNQEYEFKNYNFKYAWNPSWNRNIGGSLFDLAGSVNVNKEIVNIYNFGGFNFYNSFIKTKKEYNAKENYCKSNSKIVKPYIDFFVIYKRTPALGQYISINVNGKTKINSRTACVFNLPFWEEEEVCNDKGCHTRRYIAYWYCGLIDYFTRYYYTYKLIDTRYKQVSPTSDEVSKMSFMTHSRPVNDTRYITFLGIGGDYIKLIYPDLWNIQVYKNNPKGTGYILKSPSEIETEIKYYLQRKVRKYNEYLSNQLNKSSSYYNLNKGAFDFLASINKTATPKRTYNLIPEDYFIKILGEENIKKLANYLYYQNLGASQKPDIKEYLKLIDYLRKNYNINEKIKYILFTHLNTIDNKNIFSLKNSKGYEAGYINSDGADNIDIFQTPEIISNLDSSIKNFANTNLFDLPNFFSNLSNQNLRKVCKYPSIVPIFQWPSAFQCWLTEELPKWEIDTSNSCSFTIGAGNYGSLGSDFFTTNDFSKNKYFENINLIDGELFHPNPNANIEEIIKKGYRLTKSEFEKIFSDISYDFYQANFWQKYLTNENKINNEIISNLGTLDIARFNLLKQYIFVDILPLKYSQAGSNTGNIYIRLNTDEINDVNISIGAIGESCKNGKGFFINNINICEEDFDTSLGYGHFAPGKGGELTLPLKIDTSYAGANIIQFKFCDIDNSNICFIRNISYNIGTTDIDQIDIITPTNKILRNGQLPIKISAKDKYGNEVGQIVDTYQVSISTGYLLYNGDKSSSITLSNFKKAYFIIDLNGVNKNIGKVKLTIKPLIAFNKNLPSLIKEFDIVDGDFKISKTNITYSLSEDIPFYTFDKNNKLNIVKDKLIKIDLSLTEKGTDNSLNAVVEVINTDGLFKLGHIVEKPYTIFTGGKNKVYYQKVFEELDSIIIKNGKAEVYLLPTMKAGKGEIIFKLNNDLIQTLNITVNPSKPRLIYLIPEKTNYNSGDKILVDVFVKDIWKNDIYNKNVNIKVGTFGSVYFEDGTNIKTISVKGRKTIKLIGKGGFGYLYAYIDGVALSKQKADYVKFSIKEILFPTKDLNILYLSLFGNDWGNLWGYFSESKQFVSNLIKDSSKLLSVTTMLTDPDKIYKTYFVLNKDLSVDLISNVLLSLKFKNGNIYYEILDGSKKLSEIIVGKVYDFNYGVVENIDNLKFSNNIIVYMPETLDDFIISNIFEDGKIKINNIVIVDFKGNYISNDVKIAYKGKTFEVYYKNKLVGKLKVTRVDDYILKNYKKNINVYENINYTLGFSEGNTNNMESVYFYDPRDVLKYKLNSEGRIENSKDIDQDVGFRAKFKNITLWAAGNNVGESTIPGFSEFTVNFGDPVLQNISKNDKVPNTVYSKDLGKLVYNSDKNIFKVIPADFNNDGLEDLFIAYKDGSIRLLKNYGGNFASFNDLGELALITDGIKDIFVGDANKDGYSDVFVWTQKNSLRFYENKEGKIDIDGRLICLDVASDDGKNLSNIKQLFIQDFDKDGSMDIVLMDNLGDIWIYYGPSFISSFSYKCDENYKSKLNKKLIRSYKVKLTSEKVYDNSLVHWEGLKAPNLSQNIDYNNQDGKLSSVSNVSDTQDLIDNYENIVNQGLLQNQKYVSVPSLIGKPIYENITGDTVSYIRGVLSQGEDIEIYKVYTSDVDYLRPKDKVIVNVYIKNNTNEVKNVTYLENISGPWYIAKNDDGSIAGFDRGSLNDVIIIDYNVSPFVFKIDNIKLNPKEVKSFSFEVYYQGTEPVKISLFDKNSDGYTDIKLAPSDGCIKGYEYALNGGKYRNWSIKVQKIENKLVQDIKKRKEEVQNFVNEYISKIQNQDLNVFDEVLGEENWVEGPSDGNYNLSYEANISLFESQAMSKYASQVDQVLKNLCGGFKVGDDGSCGFAPPFNMAFLSPGMYNIFGCPLAWDPGLPIFWWPGNWWQATPAGCIGPFPIPYMGSYDGPPIVQYAPTGCGPNMPLQSLIRLYISPTITMGVGFAACFGSYNIGTKLPVNPFGNIAGNCVVVATQLGNKCSKNNTNNNFSNDDQLILDEWQIDLGNGGSCNKQSYGININTSPLRVFNGSISDNFSSYDQNLFSENNVLNVNSNIAYIDSTSIGSIADAKELLLKGGNPINLKIEGGNVKGLVACIIKKWLDNQIRYIINNLTNMTIYIYLPDISQLGQGFDKLFENIKKDLTEFNFREYFSEQISSIKTAGRDPKDNVFKNIFFPKQDVYDQLSDVLSNPFEKIASYFDEVPLINVTTRTITIKIPWLTEEQLNMQIDYLSGWLYTNKQIAKQWLDNKYLSVDVNKLINSVEKNIQILEQWKMFPFVLYDYLHSIDKLIDSILCVLDNFLVSFINWLKENARRFEAWIDFIISLLQIIKTRQILIDFSVNWRKSCAKCRQDNYDFYSCVLGLLCIDLPILPIPPFKLPDIYIDFSHIDLGINIILPEFRFVPIPLPFIRLPNLPPPFTVNVQLPSIPILPPPPNLPSFEFALPSWKVKFPPLLPPAPSIPPILPQLSAVIDIAEWIGKIWCIIKNGIGLVAEWNVKTRIEQLTQRSSRVFPFDFLSLTIPQPPLYGFDIRADTYIGLKLNFSYFYDILKKFVDDNINKFTDKIVEEIYKNTNSIQQKLDQFNIQTPSNINIEIQGYLPSKLKDLFYYDTNSVKGYKVEFVKNYLKNGLKYLIKKDKYKGSEIRKIMASNIINILDKDIKVRPNIGGVEKVINEAKNYLNNKKSYYTDLAENIKKDGWNYLQTLIKDNKNSLIKYDREEIRFTTKIFDIDQDILNEIKSATSPFKSYFDLNYKLVSGFANKLNTNDNISLGMGKKDYDNLKIYFNGLLQTANKVGNKLSITEYSPQLPKKEKYILQTVSDNSGINLDNYFDYASAIRGFYIEGNDGKYYNVIGWLEKGDKIRKNKSFVIKDINGDGKDDILWWDTDEVYIKFAEQNRDIKDNVSVNYYNIYTLPILNSYNDIKDLVDENGYIQINNEYFKIYSSNFIVYDFKRNGNNFDNISFSWRSDNSKLYVIKFFDRIDVSKVSDKVDMIPRYVLVVDNDIDLAKYKLKLDNLDNFLYDLQSYPDVFKVIVTDLDIQDVVSISLSDIPRTWWYGKISSLKLNGNYFKKVNPWSKQILVGRDIWSDNLSPIAEVSLIRDKTGKIVSKGFNLKGYINTKYRLQITWTDNNSVYQAWITDFDGNILKQVNGNILELTDLYYHKPGIYKFYIYSLDIVGNISKQLIQLKIDIPKIEIEKIKISDDKLYAEIGVILENSIDDGFIRFYRNRNGIWELLTGIDGSNNISDFKLNPYSNFVTGGLFVLDKKLYFQDLEQKIAELDLENGKLDILKDGYKYNLDLTTGIPYILVYRGDIPIFKLFLKSDKLIGLVLNGSDLNRIKLENIDGIFKDGYCIYSISNNACIAYVSNKGDIWIPEEFRGDIKGKYLFDEEKQEAYFKIGYEDNYFILYFDIKVK